MDPTVSAPPKSSWLSTATLVKIAGACAALGIASSITEYGDYGRWLTVLGVVLLIVALHRFGRSGPDPIIFFEADAPRKKKKKRTKADGEPVDSERSKLES